MTYLVWRLYRVPGAIAAVLLAAFAAFMVIMQSAGFRQFVTYQPQGRYWAFQAIETAIFIALAAALIAGTFYLIRRHDALDAIAPG